MKTLKLKHKSAISRQVSGWMKLVRKPKASLVILLAALAIGGVYVLFPAMGQTRSEWEAMAPHLRFHESGNDYANYDEGSNGHYGAYQFAPSTWDGVARETGRTDLIGVNPADASPADQDAMAYHLYKTECTSEYKCYIQWEAWPKAKRSLANGDAVLPDGCKGAGACGGQSGTVRPAAPSAPAQPVDCGSQTLRVGSSGQCVKELQEKLNAAGYNVGPADGSFGSKTQEALKHFQHDSEIGNSGCVQSANQFFDQVLWYTCDGVAGSATREALNNADTRPDASTKEGCRALGLSEALCSNAGDYPTVYDECRDRGWNCSTIQLPPTYDESEFIYGGDYCDANPQDCRGERGYGAVLCADAPSDPNCYTPPPPNYNEEEFIYGGDYCDANPNDCGATNEPGYEGYYEEEFIYGGDYCDANPNDCGATNEPGYEGYYEEEFIYGGDYCDANPNDCGATNEPGYEGYYEEEFIYGGDYCDARPRDCDPSYEGGYESYYEEEYIYGGDYCDENPWDCGEPGYEGGYEGYYEEEYIYGGDYCDENPWDCGEGGYENSYEGGYEGYYEDEYIYGGDYCDANPWDCGGEGGYENGYEGYYEGYYGGAQQY
jgi:hypothetical protein